MPNAIPTHRREAILSRLLAGETVHSGSLAAEFRLSEDAIRRDLRSLAAEGLCRRVYGGAMPLGDATPMTVRVSQDMERKRGLATAAMPFVEPSSFIFVDNGSSNLAFVNGLPAELNLTIATSSIAIAAALEHRDDVELLLVGGAIDRLVGGAVDGVALETVSRFNIDLCLLGACAVSVAGGVSAFGMADASFKRTIAARSRRTIVLATNDKLDRQAPYRVLDVDLLDHVIIEHDADFAVANELAAAGATIVRADAQAPTGHFRSARPDQ